MNKQEAIEWLHEITNGRMDRNEKYDEIPKGEIAEVVWYSDAMFGYGMEYGAILAIMKIFDLTKKDLV